MLALHAKQGDSATLVCATLGQMGRNMGNPVFSNRESLSKIREKELRDACDALGTSDIRLLGLHDKTVEFEDPEYVAELRFNALRELRPTRVYSYYSGHGVHPNHDVLAEATMLAVSKLPEGERPVIYASAFDQVRNSRASKNRGRCLRRI
jgi:N-acetylglucosamine malate deacetylase 2